MNGLAIALVAIDALLALVVTLTSGLVLFLVKRRSDREEGRDRSLRAIEGDMRSLREGMSQGAREAIGHLAGRVDVLEDAHEQLSGKVVELRTQQRILDRTVEGHIGTARTHAHPPGMGPPVPA